MICSGCKNDKQAAEFYKNSESRTGYRSTCKACDSSRIKDWRNNRNGKHTARNQLLLKLYNLDLNAWNVMFEAQGSCCAICKKTKHGGTGWNTDHDHVTGKVRGILCYSCNISIGRLGDNYEGVFRALTYLAPNEDNKVEEHW